MDLDFRLWGKARGLVGTYPVACHLTDTAVIASALWDLYLTSGQRRLLAEGWGVPEEHARDLVAFWAGCHDVGKASPEFQIMDAEACALLWADGEFPFHPVLEGRRLVRHERVTGMTLPAALAERGYSNPARPLRSVAHQVGQALSGHHGAYGPALSPAELANPVGADSRIGGAGWTVQRRALVGAVYELCGRPEAPGRLGAPGAVVVTTGLVVLADWLASHTPDVQARLDAWDEDLEAHATRIREQAPDVIARAQLGAPIWRDREPSFNSLFPGIDRPHPLQADVSERLPGLVDGPGLVLVTAPTGDGKTEVGLLAARLLGEASGTEGLVFLLPTMATTDAMHQRLRNFVGSAAAHDVPVGLMHSMAWLNPAYGPDSEFETTGECVATEVGDWLRGRHRTMLARIGAGTWDQAAVGVLPVRWTMLRWLGMSGAVLVVDEAHAYDAYGHAVTCRLLEWCGHLGVSVVLLSATLAGRTATSLVNAYRKGAGHPDPVEAGSAYPGWLHVSATTGTVSRSGELETTRARRVRLVQHPVTMTHDPDVKDGRARAILDALEPLRASREGVALVICTTVGEAQATRRMLATTWGSHGPLVRLLHARMPVRQRGAITARVTRWIGKHGRRPPRPAVIVATQVIEQSLDIDADVIVSDLAPVALLLQRAGRCWRHDRDDRPTWCTEPVVHVLSPRGTLPPAAWGRKDRAVYDGSLLRRTRDLLDDLPGPVAIPEEVQEMIETVYAAAWTHAAQLGDDDIARLGRENAMESTADMATIPVPARVRDLYPLTSPTDPDLAVTRLGAESLRLLPVYIQPSGDITLDHTGRRPLPARPDRAGVRALIERTVTVPHEWLARVGGGLPDETALPEQWSEIGGLRGIRLLPITATRDRAESAYRAPSGHAIRISRTDGLTREHTT